MDILSNEIIYNILLYCNIKDLRNINLVNKLWNNIIMDDILWKDKLYLDFDKCDKGNFKRWYDRYITIIKKGKILICELPNDAYPGLGQDITIGHEGGQDIIGRMLPYEGIKCIYGFNYIAILTEYLELKVIDVIDRIQHIVDCNIDDIIHGGADTMIYLKDGDVWCYVHDGFEKIQRVTCGEMIRKVSYCHPYISYVDKDGRYNRRYHNDETEAWDLIITNGYYDGGIQDIADLGSDVLIFTKDKTPISLNCYLCNEVLNVIKDNNIDRMDCNLTFYVKDRGNIILLDVDYDFNNINECRGYILNNDFEGINGIKCVSTCSEGEIMALCGDGIVYLRFYNYDIKVRGTVDFVTQLTIKAKSIYSGYNISVIM
ncbi:F-box domain-containing protein [Orpheovirus IHUMI-LCC2]|uniref:F-box domain-containing protein n=1 Tax=Orpheovirus IHUMI-LCC2 TaxID=2023057 RepID=A0A2I2L3P2_9VIRU|nr:F-box domain-containing protein [Orpheovirus IHUMI-LCC2]SNW62131.1 F-box domain-containing protein [Orpheovirus IHUMI-LCC2]